MAKEVQRMAADDTEERRFTIREGAQQSSDQRSVISHSDYCVTATRYVAPDIRDGACRELRLSFDGMTRNFMIEHASDAVSGSSGHFFPWKIGSIVTILYARLII